MGTYVLLYEMGLLYLLSLEVNNSLLKLFIFCLVCLPQFLQHLKSDKHYHEDERDSSTCTQSQIRHYCAAATKICCKRFKFYFIIMDYIVGVGKEAYIKNPISSMCHTISHMQKKTPKQSNWMDNKTETLNPLWGFPWQINKPPIPHKNNETTLDPRMPQTIAYDEVTGH